MVLFPQASERSVNFNYIEIGLFRYPYTSEKFWLSRDLTSVSPSVSKTAPKGNQLEMTFCGSFGSLQPVFNLMIDIMFG